MADLLVPALLGFVAGTACQLSQRALSDPAVYGVALGLGILAIGLLWARQVAQWTGRVGAALALAALAFGLTGLRAVAFQAKSLAPRLEGRDLLVTGVVIAMPQLFEQGLRLRMRVEEATDQALAVRLPPVIALGWYLSGSGGSAVEEGDSALPLPIPVVRAGERWRMQVRLKAPHGNSNPFGFDYELWMWEQGLQASGYVRQGERDVLPSRLGQTGRHPVEFARQLVRDRILERVASPGHAGWIAALVTGDQNAIERADWDVFRATGVAHLMAISGLHVTMFAWLAAALVGSAWRRSERLSLWFAAPHAALIGGFSLALGYAVFSGWGVPSQRTVWMLGAVCLLRLSGRQWPWPLVWLLAGAVVLLIDPWAWMQAGFWLSFVAVGVLFASAGRADGSDSGLWINRVRAMLREQWVITLALTPLVLLLFGQVSVVGFVANLLAIPWVTLLVTPLSLGGMLFEPLWDLAASAIAALAWYLTWLAQLPFATVSIAMAPWWVGVAGVAGGLLLVMRLPASLRLAGATLLLPILLWQAPRPVSGQFELLAADIGQGNAVLVRTANHALLYDAGPRYSRDSDAGHRVLVPLLRAFAVRLDLLVISHRDTDHVGGALSVLAMQPQSGLLSSIETDHTLQAVRPATRCEAGQGWIWDGVQFEVLHPRAADYEAPAKPNALSCVLRIASAGSGASAALLTGDIESQQELRMVGDRAQIRADLLLVPHHGSKTSSSAAFLDAVQPRVALVQSGYRNRFGHPAALPLARYHERRILVRDSPHCGALVWNSGEPASVRCDRIDRQRYWHHIAP